MNRRGAVLPLALFVLLLIAAMTASLATLSGQNLMLSRGVMRETTTEQAAQGALALLARMIDRDHTYAGTAEGQIGKRSWYWTFDPADAAHPRWSVNNVDGSHGDPYVHPPTGAEVPKGSVLLAATVESMTVYAVYKEQWSWGLASRLDIHLRDVSGLDDLIAMVYSNLQHGDSVAPPCIDLRSLEGEAYTVLESAGNPVVIDRATDVTRVFYDQPTYTIPQIDIEDMIADARAGTNVVIVGVSAGAIAITGDATPPFSAADFECRWNPRDARYDITYKSKKSVTLSGPVKYLFEGNLVLPGGPNLTLTGAAELYVAGSLQDHGSLRSLDGTVIASGDVDINGTGATNRLSVLSLGSILMSGGGEYEGLFYTRDPDGIEIDGGGEMRGIMIAESGGIDAPNVDFIFDPTYAEKFKEELGWSMVRSAWWCSQ